MYSSYAQSFFPFSGQKMMNKNPLQKDEKELGKSWKLTRNQMMPRFKGEEPFPAFWVSRVAHLSKGDANKTKESRQVCEMILGKLPKYMKLTKKIQFTMSTSTMSTSTISMSIMSIMSMSTISMSMWTRGERIVFWWPNTNTNIIWLFKNDRIRIRILFGLKKATEYEY